MAEPQRDPASSPPLLDTKFFIPRWRPGQVARPRLLQRLNRGAEAKLTLVSAPAGFGKTTLLAEWLDAAPTEGQAVAWLSLDQRDNDPATFWTYMVTALQRVLPGVGANANALLRSPRPPPVETLLPVLLNEVGAVPDDVLLVLDDYHLIDAGPIHEGIAFLLDHLPPRMHLVITGRADPPLPLARLRGRGELTEVRAADLRFTPEEAAAFLNEAMGLALSAREVSVLEARTEGWIAGLQLAALSMQGRDDVAGFIAAFTGDDRYIVDYLVEEVLARQPTDVRRFLLQTSILDRLSGPLCDAVTGAEGGRGHLEALERGNLFVVPLDDRRQWYRYHHLFADVLRAHLMEEEPDQVAHLHGRASAWFERNDQPSEAIRHAFAAKNVRRAAGLVEMGAEATVRAHQPNRLVEWLNLIPDDLIRSMPVLSTYAALALQGLGQIEGAESRLRDAERWLGEDTGAGDASTAPRMLVVDHAGLQTLPSRIALARGYQAIVSGDVPGTVAHARRALDLLPADEHHWRGTAAALVALAHWATGDLTSAHRYHSEGTASLERAGDILLAISMSYHGGQLLAARGRLSEARSDYEHALQLAARHGESTTFGTASLHFGLSELCCERGDFDAAEQHMRLGEEIGTSPGLPRVPYRRCLALARLLCARGDLAAALALIEQAEGLWVRDAVPDVRPLAALKARVWLAQGRLTEAEAWTRAAGVSVDDELRYPQEYAHITLARVLLTRSVRDQDLTVMREVDGLLARLHEAAEVGGRTGTVIEILVLRAIVEQALGDITAALLHLGVALTLAEPEGYLRLFVDAGEPGRALLRHAAAAGLGGAYTRRLLAAFEEPGAPVVAATGLVEPLTAREIEILHLVATGMTNQQIADHLVISLPTVKRHVANLYGKLDVSHRTEAVARAKALSLL